MKSRICVLIAKVEISVWQYKVVVAQLVILKITKGREVPESDPKALANFYFEIAACLNTLLKTNYVADIHRTDLLRQTLSKLPVYLQRKWSEYSLSLWKREELNLYHLEKWLLDRVIAARDPYLTNDNFKKITNTHNWTLLESTEIQSQKRRCSLCGKENMCCIAAWLTNSKVIQRSYLLFE